MLLEQLVTASLIVLHPPSLLFINDLLDSIDIQADGSVQAIRIVHWFHCKSEQEAASCLDNRMITGAVVKEQWNPQRSINCDYQLIAITELYSVVLTVYRRIVLEGLAQFLVFGRV